MRVDRSEQKSAMSANDERGRSSFLSLSPTLLFPELERGRKKTEKIKIHAVLDELPLIQKALGTMFPALFI